MSQRYPRDPEPLYWLTKYRYDERRVGRDDVLRIATHLDTFPDAARARVFSRSLVRLVSDGAGHNPSARVEALDEQAHVASGKPEVVEHVAPDDGAVRLPGDLPVDLEPVLGRGSEVRLRVGHACSRTEEPQREENGAYQGQREPARA